MTQPQMALEAKEKMPVVLTEPDSFFDDFKKTTQSIAHRAFEIFEKRGREFGHEVEDWLRAESELARRVPIEVKEAGGKLEIRVEVPGFKLEELKVFVEPRRLTISGSAERSSENKDANTLYSERRNRKIFRSFDLPREVKTADVAATLKDGILSLTLQKTEMSAPNQVAIKTA